MADYLTGLVSRTLGLTPVAEPAIAPLFAPGRAASVVTGAEAFGNEPGALPDSGGDSVRLSLPAVTLGDEVDRPAASRLPPQRPSAEVSQPPSTREGKAVPVLTSQGLAIPVEAGYETDAEPPKQVSPFEGRPEGMLLPSVPAPPAQKPSGEKKSTPAEAVKKTESKLAPPPPESVSLPEGASAGEKGKPPVARLRPGVPPAVSVAVLKTWPESETSPLPPRSTAPLGKRGKPPTVPDGSRLVASSAKAPSTLAKSLVEPQQEMNFPEKIPLSRTEPPVVRRQPLEAAPSRNQEALATIEITIGRVEVHALYPPAPATQSRKAGPAPPRVSLEAYLRSQNGERR